MAPKPSPRTFEDAPATRERSPVLVGLTGASGGGKTFSALRLASGIVKVGGGEIFVVDTDNRRALHYADRFAFRHVPFDPPHGSLDYVAALRHCVMQGAGCIVVDSMSHEHEGVGGMMEFHEAELDRMAGQDYAKRERMKMLAWAEPKAARRKLLLEIQRLQVPAIFCFRAKQTAKPVKVDGKTEVVQQGFVPIAGDDFVFEMTMNALLLPGAEGRPTWAPEHPGEKLMTKLPIQFAALRNSSDPIDEALGERLAKWANLDGQSPSRPPKAAKPAEEPSESAEERQDEPPAADEPPPPDAAPDGPGEDDAPIGDGPPADDVEDQDLSHLSPAEKAELEAAEKRQAERMKPAEPSAPGAAWDAFAEVLVDAEDWPTILAGFKALANDEAYKAEPYDQQMNARRSAYLRLRQLNDAGYSFDFLSEPHAFRCYIEAETEVGVLEYNAEAFRGSPVGQALPSNVWSTFETAIAKRKQVLASRAADQSPEDFQ